MIKKIKADLVEAMKAKQEFRKSVLRMLLAKLEQEKVKLKLGTVEDLTEAQVMSVVVKAGKELDNEIEEYQKVGREVDKQLMEKEILKAYLPKQLTESEIQDEVNQMFALANYNRFKGDLDITEKLFEFLEDKIETEIMPTGRDDVTLVVEF